MLLSELEIVKEFKLRSSNFLAKCTIQLFRMNSEEGIKAHGSGVLFSFNSKFFIISAAHNFLDEEKESIRLRIGPHLEKIEDADLIYTLLVGDPSVDKIDISVLHIRSQELIKQLQIHNEFIHVNDIIIDHEQKIVPQETGSKNGQYLLFGYPGKQTKKIYKSITEWKVKALSIEIFYTENDIQRLKESGFVNHILFNKLNKGYVQPSNDQIHLPEFGGLSGCGLWDFSGFDLENQRMNTKLVGIFIEIRSNLGISTKIDFAIELIRAHFNEITLPISNHVLQWQKQRRTT